jgi:hypothetical protein
MITVTDIFNDKGQLVGRVAKCDCSKNELSWYEIAAGVLGALIVLHLMVI